MPDDEQPATDVEQAIGSDEPPPAEDIAVERPANEAVARLNAAAYGITEPPASFTSPYQDLQQDDTTGLMLPPVNESELNTAAYAPSCYCHPCQVTRNYRRLVYAYLQQEMRDAQPREAYRAARQQTDRLISSPAAGDSRAERESWDAEFKHLYARWARTHQMLGYPSDAPATYRSDYAESLVILDEAMRFQATPTGYTPPVEINFASASINNQVSTYERQVSQAKSTITMAAGELKGGNLALRGLYVQQANAEKAVKNSDDLVEMCKEMPELIGIKYGPYELPGGASLQQGEIEVLFLPVLYGRSTRSGMQKQLTSPVSFRITQDGRVYGAGRINHHPHLRSESICLGYMGARRGYSRGASVELILSTLAGVNDIGGMLKLMSAWRLGHNLRDELGVEWRWDGVLDFFDTDRVKRMWPEWDGTTVQYAPRGVIGPLDRWLPGIFDMPNLTHTQIGQAISLLWKNMRGLSPYLDADFINQLRERKVVQCRICYDPAIALVTTYNRGNACFGCAKREDGCKCAANPKRISRHQVRYYPSESRMFYPIRPPTNTMRREPKFWWCAGQHADYMGNYKYDRRLCGNGPTLRSWTTTTKLRPLYGMAWLQCETWSNSPWTFKALEPRAMRCYNHSIGSMIGERGELNIRG